MRPLIPPTSSRQQDSFTKQELNLLNFTVVQPSGKTLEYLAQQMVRYIRVSVRCSKLLASNEHKCLALYEYITNPETRPQGPVTIDEMGVTQTWLL
jgi:hypothetical protein